MKHSFYALPLILTMAACSSQGELQDENTIKEPFLSAEIMTQHKMAEKMAQELSGEKKTKGELKEYSFFILKGESLREAIERFADSSGFKRAIIDVNKDSVDPSRVISNNNIAVKGENLFSIGAKLSEELGATYKEFAFYEAADGGEKSLVASDRGYRERSMLVIFDVERGTLLENAERLASLYGWGVDNNAWEPSVEYRVKYGYPLVSKNIVTGMSRLFNRYPVQAQLMQSTRKVVFAKRPLPTNQ